MKKFKVPVWWQELHGGNIVVEATNEDEAYDIVSKSLGNMIGDIEGETFCDFAEMGIDYEDIQEVEEFEKVKEKTDTEEVLYKYVKKSYEELLEDIISLFKSITGFNNAEINIDLCNDGNIDAYINYKFSKNDVVKLIDIGWLGNDILEDWEEGSNPFDLDDYLSYSHNLFAYLLGKTYGDNAMIIGNYSMDEDNIYNILIPKK